MGYVQNYSYIILCTLILCCDRVNPLFKCPISCSCFSESASLLNTVKCTFDGFNPGNVSSLFPFVLPINSSIVELQKVDGQVFFSRMSFEDSSWSQVLELTITGIEVTSSHISNNSLHGLENLKVLRIHFFIGSVESGVFLNTPNIVTLDLSDNPFLHLDYLSWALRNAVPKLKYLDISRIQHVLDRPVVLGPVFTESIRTKHLEVLNVSGTKRVSLDNTYSYSSIQVLNISRTSLEWIPRHTNKEWFPNVRELDISYSSYVHPYFLPSSIVINEEYDCSKHGKPFRTLRYLYAHDIFVFTSSVQIIDGYFNIICESILIEYIDISNSNIRCLNFSTNAILLYLKTFIIAHNSLEYISPKLLYALPNLSILRLERNKLSAMQYFPDFENIFSKNEALATLDLSWNGLSFLPRRLFVSLRILKQLNLQGNRIVYFNVDVKDLFNLRTLDLSENGPVLISSAVTRDLDTINSGTLYFSTSTNASTMKYLPRLNATYTNTTPIDNDLAINLQGNTFDCSCEHILFLSWLTESKLHFKGRTSYACGQELNNKKIDKDNVRSLDYYCNLQSKLPFIIAPIIILGLLIVCLVLIMRYVRKRRKLYKERRQYVKGYVKCDTEMVDLTEKFYPAFLSFCSIDNDIAKNYFCPTITKALQTHFEGKEVLAMGDSIIRPGRLILSEIEECLSRCDVIIFLVTLDFIESDWCQFELNQADLQRKPTIYLVENTVLKRKLPSCLRKIKTHTRATWRRKETDIEITPDWDVIARQVVDFAVVSKRENGH
ncbi:hypothetical protein ACJMK2_004635 [Sinanodonta woodiana]|uniref:TIR domain-containing protein n=1 Tax=Sinanodonta woodiana TaxID=1069815 RepID=A0ABD3Y1S1_SINWO